MGALRPCQLPAATDPAVLLLHRYFARARTSSHLWGQFATQAFLLRPVAQRSRQTSLQDRFHCFAAKAGGGAATKASATIARNSFDICSPCCWCPTLTRREPEHSRPVNRGSSRSKPQSSHPTGRTGPCNLPFVFSRRAPWNDGGRATQRDPDAGGARRASGSAVAPACASTAASA